MIIIIIIIIIIKNFLFLYCFHSVDPTAVEEQVLNA